MARENPISSAFGFVVNNNDGESYSWLALRYSEDFGMEVVKKPPGAMHTFFNYQSCLAEMRRHGVFVDHLSKQPPSFLSQKLSFFVDPSQSTRPRGRFRSIIGALFYLTSLIPPPGAEHTADFELISAALKRLRSRHDDI